MGGGSWTSSTYEARASHKSATGKSTFDYHDTTSRAPSSSWKVHETLDPKMTNKNGAHTGMTTREALDSDEHPSSKGVAVVLDVTGSNVDQARIIHGKLPELLGVILRKGYLADPQILFAAVGDATCDRVPLQVGQFESDNRMDEHLENFFLEGNGGGQMTESYELGAYFLARHTYMDCVEKRGERGYAFFIGDEMAYPRVDPRQVKDLIGDDLAEPVTTEAIFAELQRSFDVYFIVPLNASHGRDPSVADYWRGLLGQNVITLDDSAAICETIALTIGLGEGTVDLDEGAEHLREAGASEAAIRSASTALARVGSGAVAPATASGALPDVPGDSGGVDRL
jgi:hypothetical protein